MSYLKFLFNDKKAMACWIVILIGNIVVSIIYTIVNAPQMSCFEFSKYYYK